MDRESILLPRVYGMHNFSSVDSTKIDPNMTLFIFSGGFTIPTSCMEFHHDILMTILPSPETCVMLAPNVQNSLTSLGILNPN